MKRLITLVVVAGLLLIGGIAAYSLYNKKHVDVVQATAYQTLTANALVDRFNENEEAATTEFIDQVLEVSGIVTSIETNNEVHTIYLQSGDLMKSVSCEIDGALDTSIEVGDQIAVRGICAGSLMDVVMVQCKTL